MNVDSCCAKTVNEFTIVWQSSAIGGNVPAVLLLQDMEPGIAYLVGQPGWQTDFELGTYSLLHIHFSVRAVAAAE